MGNSATRTTVHLGLGANLGERREQLQEAVDAIEYLEKTSVRAVSSPYRTEPRIVEDQPEFINACSTIETGLAPRKLLEHLQRIERDRGLRPGPDKGPRHLDLDILLWGDRVLEQPNLTVPHPGLPDRRFVLAPLAEIAPDVRDPRTGETVEALLAACEDEGAVDRIEWTSERG